VLGVLYIVFGAVILPIDYLVGMPWFWIVCEGPFVIGMGTVIVWLTVRGDRQGADNP
jgi:hypothetical protein